MTSPTTGRRVLGHWALVFLMISAPVLHPLPPRSRPHLLGGREKSKRTIAERSGDMMNHISAAGLVTSIVTLVSKQDS